MKKRLQKDALGLDQAVEFLVLGQAKLKVLGKNQDKLTEIFENQA